MVEVDTNLRSFSCKVSDMFVRFSVKLERT